MVASTTLGCTVCVALCTYNGSAYLAEQLASIRRQTRLPDSMVILDDASRDTTVRILERFAREAPFPVRIVVNERNLGYTRNFERAIALAAGDVVALCDQDDVWHPSKLASLERALREHPAAALAFSDAEMVDASLRSLGYRLWQATQFCEAQQAQMEAGQGFELLCRGNLITGATMAFRTELRSLVLPIDTRSIHDAWIALLAAAVAPVALVSEPLISYRQHGHNQIGMRRTSARQRLTRERGEWLHELRAVLRHLQAARERLVTRPDVPREKLLHLDAMIDHLAGRTSLPARRLARLPFILRELVSGRYRRLTNGLSTAVRDLVA